MEEVVLTETFCVGVTEVLVFTEKHQVRTKNANHLLNGEDTNQILKFHPEN